MGGRVFDRAAIAAYTVMYVTVHTFNYHDPGDAGASHRAHHRNPETNFGPEIFDRALGTTDRLQNLDHMTPNILLSLLVALAVCVWQAEWRAS
jgi:hypothetical protein